MYEAANELMERDPPIKSVYLSEPLWMPSYSQMHRQHGDAVKLIFAEWNPMFWREREGFPLSLTFDSKITHVLQLTNNIEKKVYRPEFVLL